MMKKADVLQATKFMLVGLFNTAVDYGLFMLFFSLFNWDKNIAQILATGFAMANSYLINRYWTFHKTGHVEITEVGRFLVVNILSLLTTLLCLNLFHDVFYLHDLLNRLLQRAGLSFRLEGDVSVLLCKVLASPFSMAVNFLGNRFWVFGNESKQKK